MEVTFATKSRSLACPFCEARQLRTFRHNSARCDSSGDLLSGALLETLQGISRLPDAVGSHACECGHPEMRLLPEGVYRCPAGDSEVLPVQQPDPSPSAPYLSPGSMTT
jgi:hypothetical protein